MEAAASGFLSRAASTKRVVREFRRVSINTKYYMVDRKKKKGVENEYRFTYLLSFKGLHSKATINYHTFDNVIMMFVSTILCVQWCL